MPTDPLDITTTWDILLPRFVNIFRRIPPFCEFIGSYTLIYDIVTSMSENSCTLLYEKIKGFFVQYAENLRLESEHFADHELLQFYCDNWVKYVSGSNGINGICGYLNSSFINTTKNKNKAFHCIKVLAILCWEENFLQHIADHLTSTILNLKEKKQNGDTITISAVKSVLGALNSGTLNSYLIIENIDPSEIHCDFQESYIKLTTEYYENFLENMSFPEYLKWTREIIEQEVNLATGYLESKKWRPLRKALKEVLIANHLERFYAEFVLMLEKNQIQDLGRMYILCKWVDENGYQSLVKLQEIMETHIEEKVKAAVLKDPKHYVTVILNVYKHFKTLVRSAFCNNSDFVEITNKACATFITKHLEQFYSEFDSMLDKNQIEDLGRMYSLCKRVDGALVNLCKIMQTHIVRKGQDAIAREKETIIKNPKQYVTVILDVYKQFNAIVHSAFGNDTGFVEARDKACATFINCNAVANNQNKSPELLARYCDMVMKTSSQNNSGNIDNVLDEIIIILNYIEDKDVFHNIYSKFLARRLINKTSASEDCESSMLMKLKNIYGWQYTNNLQRMFNENRLNQELNDSFKKYLQDKIIQNKNPKLSVMVLAQSVWPYAKTEICAVPPLLQSSFDKFTDFYFQKHQARKLTILPNLSRGELTTTCFANRQYIFSASLPQILLILMYNDSTEYTVQAICDHLKMTPKDLISIMQPMITINLFKTNAPIDNVSSNQVVSLNLKFSSKKIRIDLLKPAQRAESSNESNNKNTNDVDVLRRHVIDATIVRIMKARKELKHQLLIGDVINQLKNRFKPQIPVIKIAIESLIEREYLQRKIDEPDVYTYLA